MDSGSGDLRLDAYDLVVTERRVKGRSIPSVASLEKRTASYRLDVRVTRTGYVLTFRTGWRSAVTLVVEPRTTALSAALGKDGRNDRIEISSATDEYVREGKRYRLSFLARIYEPRVEREFPRLVESIEKRCAGGDPGDTLVVRHPAPNDLTVVLLFPRDEWITVEALRSLPAERRVLSTYSHLQVSESNAADREERVGRFSRPTLSSPSARN